MAIYGPNASGKSNLMRALSVVGDIANRQPMAHPSPLPVTPFAFDRTLANKPSVFELHFIRSGLRYSFELKVTASQIVHERLVSFPHGKATLLYERNLDAKGETYVHGEDLIEEVGADVLHAWQKLTSPTLLFVAQAVANSSRELKLLRSPFEWLSESSMSLMNGMSEMVYSAQSFLSKARGGEQVAAFLREFDVPVSRVKVTPAGGGLGGREFKTTLTHRTAIGEADIAFGDESEGTKNLFGFWLPWVTKEPPANSPRCLLQVDEIDSSLHPKIVEALVSKHLNAPRISQLIFTTHDTHLMDSGLLLEKLPVARSRAAEVLQEAVVDNDLNPSRRLHELIGLFESLAKPQPI